MPSFDFLFLALAATVLLSRTGPAACQDPPSPPPAPSAPHKGCQLFAQTEHAPRELLVGRDYEVAHRDSTSGYRVAHEAGPTAATCTNGWAAGYPCSQVDLLSVTTNRQLCSAEETCWQRLLNDLWGWTHEGSGREFALVGMRASTAFVEVTDPFRPAVVGHLPTAAGIDAPGSFWRDIKTIGHHALIVSEEPGHGLQVFDLERLLDANATNGTTPLFEATTRHGGFSNAHNLFVHEEAGFAYVVGSSACGGGMYVLDVTDPASPAFAGCYTQDGYVHDVQCVMYAGPDAAYAGREICFASVEDAVTVVDVTDKANPVRLSRLTYSGSEYTYTHQGWLTEDHRYFVFGDELDERNRGYMTRTHVVDVSNLAAPRHLGYHSGRSRAIDHNLYIQGDMIHQANYAAGYNLLRIVDPAAARFEEAGFFDLFPESDDAVYNGAWSVYPYLPSGNILVSGIEQGLFVLSRSRPSEQPSEGPSSLPSAPPSASPSIQPSARLSTRPSAMPSTHPSTPPSSQPSAQPSKQPSSRPTPPPTTPPTFPPTAPPTRLPTAPPTAPPTTPAPTKAPTQAPVAVATVTLTSEATFNNLEIPDNPTQLIATLENTLAEAAGNAGVEGDTTVKVTHINGNSVGRKRFFSRLGAATSTVIMFETTQRVEVSDDVVAVEQKLRQDVAAAYDMEGVNEVLQTDELQEYGNISLGRIETDLGDGSTPVAETASPTVSNAPTNSPTKRPNTDCTLTKKGKTKAKSKGGKGCKTASSKTKTTKARENTIKRNNPFK